MLAVRVQPMTRGDRVLLCAWLALLLTFQDGCRDEYGLPRSWTTTPFSPSAWRESPIDERHRFVRSLLSQHLLDGLDSPAVEQLLGRPNYVQVEGLWGYTIAWSSEAFSAWWRLYISFDPTGHVKSSVVVNE